jgi:hypothetical protein
MPGSGADEALLSRQGGASLALAVMADGKASSSDGRSSPTNAGRTVTAIQQAKADAHAEAAAAVAAGSKPVPVAARGVVKLKDIKAANGQAGGGNGGEDANARSLVGQNFMSKAEAMLGSMDGETIERTADMEIFESLENAHKFAVSAQATGRAADDTAQLRRVLQEIHREVTTKAEMQREGVSHVEILSVQLENNCVMDAEEIQRRLGVRGKMVDELHQEMDDMREGMQRMLGSRINEQAANSSRFVDYVALEKRLDTAETTLSRLELECPALEEQMPWIARSTEEFEVRRRETDQLVESCWSSAQAALDKYAQELCDEFDRALAPSTANLAALRAEMAQCQQELQVLTKPDAPRPQSAGASRSRPRPGASSNAAARRGGGGGGGVMARPRSAVVSSSYDRPSGAAGAAAAGQSGGGAGPSGWHGTSRQEQRRPASASGALSARRSQAWGQGQQGQQSQQGAGTYQHRRHRRGTDPGEPPRLLSGQTYRAEERPGSAAASTNAGGGSGGASAGRPASAGPRLLRHSPRQTLPVASR